MARLVPLKGMRGLLTSTSSRSSSPRSPSQCTNHGNIPAGYLWCTYPQGTPSLSEKTNASRVDGYPKMSLTARFAAALARLMAEMAFRLMPRLAPFMAPLLAPRPPAKRLGSPNGPPLLKPFHASFLAPARIFPTMSFTKESRKPPPP